MNKLRLIALVCIMMASTMLSAFAQDYKQVENICYRSTCDAYQAERCILDVYLLAPYSGQAVTHYEQRRLMGMSELIPLVDELAPMHHMRPGLPPMLIISGDRELELFGRCIRLLRYAPIHGCIELIGTKPLNRDRNDIVSPTTLKVGGGMDTNVHTGQLTQR